MRSLGQAAAAPPPVAAQVEIQLIQLRAGRQMQICRARRHLQMRWLREWAALLVRVLPLLSLGNRTFVPAAPVVVGTKRL